MKANPPLEEKVREKLAKSGVRPDIIEDQVRNLKRERKEAATRYHPTIRSEHGPGLGRTWDVPKPCICGLEADASAQECQCNFWGDVADNLNLTEEALHATPGATFSIDVPLNGQYPAPEKIVFQPFDIKTRIEISVLQYLNGKSEWHLGTMRKTKKASGKIAQLSHKLARELSNVYLDEDILSLFRKYIPQLDPNALSDQLFRLGNRSSFLHNDCKEADSPGPSEGGKADVFTWLVRALTRTFFHCHQFNYPEKEIKQCAIGFVCLALYGYGIERDRAKKLYRKSRNEDMKPSENKIVREIFSAWEANKPA